MGLVQGPRTLRSRSRDIREGVAGAVSKVVSDPAWERRSLASSPLKCYFGAAVSSPRSAPLPVHALDNVALHWPHELLSPTERGGSDTEPALTLELRGLGCVCPPRARSAPPGQCARADLLKAR